MKYYVLIETDVVVYAALKWKSVLGSIIDFTFNDFIVPLIKEEMLDIILNENGYYEE